MEGLGHGYDKGREELTDHLGTNRKVWVEFNPFDTEETTGVVPTELLHYSKHPGDRYIC